MKAHPHFGKHLIYYRNAFLALSSVMVLSACQKDAKTTPAAEDASTSRAAESISAVASKIDTGGLVAWYSFDSGKLTDLSSYHNRVIFNNAQLTTDRNGVANNAYSFNGNCSYMEIKNSPSLSPDREITLFAIVKFNDFYEGKCHANRILQKGSSDGVTGFYIMGTSDDHFTQCMNCSQPVDKAHETKEAGFCNVSAGDTRSMCKQDIGTISFTRMVMAYQLFIPMVILPIRTPTSFLHQATATTSLSVLPTKPIQNILTGSMAR